MPRMSAGFSLPGWRASSQTISWVRRGSFPTRPASSARLGRYRPQREGGRNNWLVPSSPSAISVGVIPLASSAPIIEPALVPT